MIKYEMGRLPFFAIDLFLKLFLIYFPFSLRVFKILVY